MHQCERILGGRRSGSHATKVLDRREVRREEAAELRDLVADLRDLGPGRRRGAGAR